MKIKIEESVNYKVNSGKVESNKVVKLIKIGFNMIFNKYNAFVFYIHIINNRLNYNILYFFDTNDIFNNILNKLYIFK